MARGRPCERLRVGQVDARAASIDCSLIRTTTERRSRGGAALDPAAALEPVDHRRDGTRAEAEPLAELPRESSPSAWM